MLRPMRAMLLAAGFGTRLDPLTRELPKPALPVANRPIAWFACDHLARAGIREMVVNTHHLERALCEALELHAPPGVQLRFVHEAVILGTGGGVRNAVEPAAGEDVLTMNAKLLFAPDVARALAVHQQTGAIATMVLRAQPEGSRFTPVRVAADGRVLGIGTVAGEPTPAGSAPNMYTGVQILSARAFRDLPENGDVIRHSYAAWLARGEVVSAVIEDAPWLDVGVTLRHYLDANLALARGALSWPGITPESGGVFVAGSGPGALSEPPRLPRAKIGPRSQLALTAVGAGAEIADEARLTRVVVWPGARAAGVLTDAIVTSSGRVVQVA
jgi:mannose-1-phosphate guanylyltransferase